MMLKRPDGEHKTNDSDGHDLEPSMIREIAQALSQVGDNGEVRLVVFKGQLCFIQIVESHRLAGDGVEENRR